MTSLRSARTPSTAILTISLFMLAGCVGGDTPTVAAPTTDAGEAAPVFDEKGNALARYALDEAVATTLWFNGTYTIQEHFFPTFWLLAPTGLAPPSGVRLFDITNEVPRGLPVQITVEVNAAVTDGDVQLWIDAPFDEVWSGTWDTPPGGHKWIETRLIHTSSDPIQVGLFYNQIDRSQSFPYELRVEIEAKPEQIIDGVGATLDVPIDAATLLVDMPEADPDAALLVWDSDQVLLGRHTLAKGTTRVPLESAGEHLLLLAQGSGAATVAIENVSEPAELGPARQEIIAFEGESGSSPVAWSFDAEREPIQIGFFVASGTVAMDFTGTVASPEGPLLHAEFVGDPPWIRPILGFGFGDWTRMGGAGLVAGTYEAQGSFGQSAGPDPIHYGHWIVYIAPA